MATTKKNDRIKEKKEKKEKEKKERKEKKKDKKGKHHAEAIELSPLEIGGTVYQTTFPSHFKTTGKWKPKDIGEIE
jgi:F0F1-type ATP synthase assembly protein I